MPRKSRIDAPGALHHIIVRGIERKAVFQDDRDRAEEDLERKYHLRAKGFDFEKVVNRVAELTGIESSEVLSAGKYKKVIAARSLVCFLGGAGVGHQSDSTGTEVKNFAAGSQCGGKPR